LSKILPTFINFSSVFFLFVLFTFSIRNFHLVCFPRIISIALFLKQGKQSAGAGECVGGGNAIGLSRAFGLDFQLHFVCQVIKEASRRRQNTEMNKFLLHGWWDEGTADVSALAWNRRSLSEFTSTWWLKRCFGAALKS
jgi:hypothetical protein